MLKLLFIFLMASNFANAQMVGGTLMEEGREMVSEVEFVQEGTVNGWATCELAVDREGNVTGVSVVETNLTRTSAKMQIRSYVYALKFEKGNHYPKFHHVQIKITLVKPL